MLKKIDLSKLKKDLRIDEYNLQKEWSKQANLFMEYAEQGAKFRQKRDNTKRKIAAKILKKNDNLSEAALNRMVDRHPKILELRYQRDQYKYAIQALEQKKKALEHEQQLLVFGFFGEPKEKSINLDEEKKKILKKKRR